MTQLVPYSNPDSGGFARFFKCAYFLFKFHPSICAVLDSPDRYGSRKMCRCQFCHILIDAVHNKLIWAQQVYPLFKASLTSNFSGFLNWATDIICPPTLPIGERRSAELLILHIQFLMCFDEQRVLLFDCMSHSHLDDVLAFSCLANLAYNP